MTAISHPNNEIMIKFQALEQRVADLLPLKVKVAQLESCIQECRLLCEQRHGLQKLAELEEKVKMEQERCIKLEQTLKETEEKCENKSKLCQLLQAKLNNLEEELRNERERYKQLEDAYILGKHEWEANKEQCQLLEQKNNELNAQLLQLQNEFDEWKKKESTTGMDLSDILKGRSNEQALLDAAEKGDEHAVKTLLNCGSDVTTSKYCRDCGDVTSLHLAAKNGHIKILALMIESGVSVNITNRNRDTPLHVAACFGNLPACKYLLDVGATIDSCNKYNNTPLRLASAKGHFPVVKLLVERGANVSLRGNMNKTAQERAEELGYHLIAEWLKSQEV